MPTLNRKELDEMRAYEPYTCGACKQRLTKNYCRECDEYYNSGHANNCPELTRRGSREDHRGHRTY